ncbi:fasciclin domain-containing protein [Phormidesmis sp. 146-33]
MKFTFSSKAVRTLGLMAMLSAMVGTSVQQSAQASMSFTSKSNVVATRPDQSSQTILDIAAANPNFSTLVTALKAAGLTRTLSGNIPLTVFAPTNQAFAALPKGTLERLLRPENRATLRKLLTYHVVPGAVESTSALRAGFAGTAEGNPVTITGNRNQIRVNNATVVSADVKASNGVIHVIDRVLLPPALISKITPTSQTIGDIAANNPNFSTLATALKAAGLTEELSGSTPLTVFAPTNEAFAALPKGTLEALLKPENRPILRRVLTNHVVLGAVESRTLRSGRVASIGGNSLNVAVNRNQIRVNNARVISADVKANNSVIHVIDRVLLPPDLK